MVEKSERIGLRVTPEQKQRLIEAAETLGLSLSGYLAFCAFERIGEKLGDKILENKKK